MNTFSTNKVEQILFSFLECVIQCVSDLFSLFLSSISLKTIHQAFGAVS